GGHQDERPGGLRLDRGRGALLRTGRRSRDRSGGRRIHQELRDTARRVGVGRVVACGGGPSRDTDGAAPHRGEAARLRADDRRPRRAPAERDRGTQEAGRPRRHRSWTRQETHGRRHRAVLIQRNISAGGRVDLTMTDTTSVPARLGIDIWLDVACPWCLLGERRRGAVIEKLAFGDDIYVRYHSYQRDPTLPETATQTQAE